MHNHHVFRRPLPEDPLQQRQGQTNLLAIADDHLVVSLVAEAEPREQQAWTPDAME